MELVLPHAARFRAAQASGAFGFLLPGAESGDHRCDDAPQRQLPRRIAERLASCPRGGNLRASIMRGR